VIYRKSVFPAGADRLQVRGLDGAIGRGQRELIIGDRQTGKTAMGSIPSSIRDLRH